MNIHIRIEASTAGIQISSAQADGPVGVPAPDEVVQDILMKAWQIMLVQNIVKALGAEQSRIDPASFGDLKRLPKFPKL